MRNESFDLVALILITALMISLAYTSVLKEQKDTATYNQSVEQIMTDKNAKLVNDISFPAYGDEDGTLSDGAVVLMTQIQDPHNLIESKVIAIDKDSNMANNSGVNDVQVLTIEEGTYKANKVKLGLKAMDFINATGAKKFGLSLQTGNDNASKNDNYFYIDAKYTGYVEEDAD